MESSYANERACYEDSLHEQMAHTINMKGIGDLDQLLAGKETWTVQ